MNKKRKILVLEKINNKGIKILQKIFKVDIKLNLSKKKQLKLIKNYDVIIIKSTTNIDNQFLSKSKKLKLVARAGTGLDNIDLNLLKLKKIKLVYTPNESTNSVVEFTLMLILLALKNFVKIQKMTKLNDFRRNELIGKDLKNTKIGIVGYGKIGKSVSKVLNMLNAKTLVYDPKYKNSSKFNDLIKNSDIISFHLPLTNKTKNLINGAVLNKMKENIILINTSRAQIFEKYFYKKTKKKFKLFTDVICPEPEYNKKNNFFKHPWLKNNNIIFTPHVASMTYKTQENISIKLAKLIIKYFEKLHNKK